MLKAIRLSLLILALLACPASASCLPDSNYHLDLVEGHVYAVGPIKIRYDEWGLWDDRAMPYVSLTSNLDVLNGSHRHRYSETDGYIAFGGKDRSICPGSEITVRCHFHYYQKASPPDDNHLNKRDWWNDLSCLFTEF